jgi:hypothetical protein
MEKTSHWLAVAYFVGGCAMAVVVTVWREWFARHIWIMWMLWAICAFSFFMALRESERFRHLFWGVASKVIPLPLSRKGDEAPMIVTTSPKQILREKVLQMGRDLFAFLREKGPMPEPKINKSMTDEEILAAGADEMSAYVDGVHYGYQGRFRQRAVDLFNELAENGIDDPELQHSEIDPPQIQNAEAVRKVAEHLFLIAARMEITEESKGT